ncbi:MAG: NADP-dependent isocitrate dehydrogenase [Saprospiraceae bacterium]
MQSSSNPQEAQSGSTGTAIPVTISYGDGIGPEIMKAVLKILKAANANIETDVIEIGEKVYLSGNTSGIPHEAWESLQKNRIFLKAPITTPQGKGYKSLNVTMRKVLGLYANVRPCVTYAPYIATTHPKMDLVIVRENEEDLYAGIEHRQTDEVYQCLKLISRPGSEKIIRYAFEYARAHGRKKVTCMSKDNIMKGTDGLFHKIFNEVGGEYPEIEQDHFIIDIGSARIANNPERFDVIVTLNLYGDIISDIAAEVSGSVGLAGSANIGDNFAMFEAIHGSAPDIAGKGVANPAGLLMGAVQMLVYIGQNDVAENIQNALMCVLEKGIHTGDIYNEEYSTQKAGTDEFADAIIEHLGQRPSKLPAAELVGKQTDSIHVQIKETIPAEKTLIGTDIFLHHTDRNPDTLGNMLTNCQSETISIEMIENRGVKVWPEGNPATFCSDHWRCRFKTNDNSPVAYNELLQLMQRITECGLEVIKTENLYLFDGQPGFSLSQGQ